MNNECQKGSDTVKYKELRF